MWKTCEFGLLSGLEGAGECCRCQRLIRRKNVKRQGTSCSTDAERSRNFSAKGKELTHGFLTIMKHLFRLCRTAIIVVFTLSGALLPLVAQTMTPEQAGALLKDARTAREALDRVIHNAGTGHAARMRPPPGMPSTASPINLAALQRHPQQPIHRVTPMMAAGSIRLRQISRSKASMSRLAPRSFMFAVTLDKPEPGIP